MRTAAGATVTVDALVGELAARLRAESFVGPLAEAREIVAGVLDASRFWPVANGAAAVDDDVVARARLAVEKRLAGAPLAYAVGRAGFRHLVLDVDERVLIPRPETEQIVDLVLEALDGARDATVVDVGTGSGAIALSLAGEAPPGRLARVYGTDISLDALAVARRNLARLEPMLAALVELVHGSMLRAIPGLRLHAVVSNPPYIALHEAASLPASVRDWEPPVALFSGGEGLSATQHLVREAAAALLPGGVLAIEVDARRASLVADLVARDERLGDIRVERDLWGRERFVLARRQARNE